MLSTGGADVIAAATIWAEPGVWAKVPVEQFGTPQPAGVDGGPWVTVNVPTDYPSGRRCFRGST